MTRGQPKLRDRIIAVMGRTSAPRSAADFALQFSRTNNVINGCLRGLERDGLIEKAGLSESLAAAKTAPAWRLTEKGRGAASDSSRSAAPDSSRSAAGEAA